MDTDFAIAAALLIAAYAAGIFSGWTAHWLYAWTAEGLDLFEGADDVPPDWKGGEPPEGQ